MGQAVGNATMTRDRSAENFAEEKFRLAVEACPSGMVMTDSTGVIVLVNSATELLFGYRRDELVGQRMEILVPERLRGEHLKQRAVFALHPQARRVQPNRELFGRRRDATEFPVEVWLNPIHAGDDLFVLSVIVDISERKRVNSAQGRVRLDGQSRAADTAHFDCRFARAAARRRGRKAAGSRGAASRHRADQQQKAGAPAQ